ncbi:MAG: hypothetical protein M1831_004035 [Alyxoria varia]|nr:MAG: hypothetical protein M1831_004035 [Alyxoria varia]
MTDLFMLEKYLKIVVDCIPKDGSPFDLQPLLFKLYLDTATVFLFGDSFSALKGETSAEAQQFLDAFDYAMFGSGMQIALGPLKKLYRDPKWLESCHISQKFAQRYVDKAISYRQSLLGRGQSEPPGDRNQEASQQRHTLLRGMAELTDNRVELRNQVLQALMAAQETTAALISNVFFLLARHPPVWQKLRLEVMSIGDRTLDTTVLQDLAYLRKLLNETLRLFPVFPQMNRVSLVDTILPLGGGSDGNSPIYVPAGTMFDTSTYVLHRSKSIWGPDAGDFDPDRWDTFQPKAWEFLPFGGGPRGCAGRLKATTEASYVIVRIAQEFYDIKSYDDREWTGQVQLTAKNANGCFIALTPT